MYKPNRPTYTMYIGALNMLPGSQGQYGFYRRGTLLPLSPDIGAESQITGIPLGSGNLCTGEPVGWRWSSLMDTGVDIRFRFTDAVFIGAVYLSLANGSAIKAVEVFTVTTGEPACVGRFDAQTGELFKGECTIPIGVQSQEIVVRLQADLKDVVLTDLDIMGSDTIAPDIYPTPVAVEYHDGQLSLASLQGVSSDSSPDADFAQDYLRASFNEYLGVEIAAASAQLGAISIGLDPKLDPEHYSIRIDSAGVRVRAAARLSLLYAVESLLQLVCDGALPYCVIHDGPRSSVRGFHFGLPPPRRVGIC